MDMEGAPSRGVVDARTLFVRDLPFSLTDEQLEEVFSEVGPVRHCFTVKEKGSEKNRGFGFVQFAVAEDASRAVDSKNGIALEGRKMKVELAKRRPPLDLRRSSSAKESETLSNANAPVSKLEPVVEQDAPPTNKKKRASVEEEKHNDLVEVLEHKHKKHKSEMSDRTRLGSLQKGKRPREEGKSSGMQRPARTVVVGGVSSTEMKEAVLTELRKVGSMETQPISMTEHELNSCGLGKDGCKPGAFSAVFGSVREARKAVAAVHHREVCGNLVWARQLGGEGAKLKKWRLIVRNLPFKVREESLRELFTAAGFVWEVTIPRKPDGNARGFAFVGFTSKGDAEKAIHMLNMKTVDDRPIAVDWAVAKSKYETAGHAGDTPQPAEQPTEEISDRDDDTASDDDEIDEVMVESKGGKMKKVHAEAVKQRCRRADSGKTPKNELGQCDDTDMVRKIVEKIVTANVESSGSGEIKLGENTKDRFEDNVEQADTDISAIALAGQEAEALARTVFVRNLPIDVKVPEMKKVFSVFGEVRTFRLVYDKTSKTPKGTAFLEFATVEAANAAVDASKGGHEGHEDGIQVRGQLLVLSIAVDREAARRSSKSDASSNIAHADDSKSIERTVFIRNLPSDVNVEEMREKFSVFGDVKSARLVLHPVTKRPKGTAFLEFGSLEAAKAAEAASKGLSKDGVRGIKLGGRSVKVDIAVGQQAAREISLKLSKEETGDRRNRHLSQEGAILEGTPAAEGVSKADLAKRKELMHEKATKLRSPNFHVSRTRLSVHNVPKSMSEADLKKMFVDAVVSRASKQKPVIKQVKILKAVTKAGGSKSRGTAFVEFTEHQHALVALRVLNNNPEVFGLEHRPIVEFAIENMKILEKRAKREAARRLAHDSRKAEQKVGRSEEISINLDCAPKQMDSKAKVTVGQQLGTVGDEVEADEELLLQRKKSKKTSTFTVGKKRKQAPEATSVPEHLETRGSRKADEASGNEMRSRSRKKKVHVTASGEGRTAMKVKKQEVGGRQIKRPRLQQHVRPAVPAVKELSRRERRREKVRPKSGEDRVDQLVSEYRSKFLSDGPGQNKSGSRSAKFGEDIRRWFE